jgi:hypothetical protein
MDEEEKKEYIQRLRERFKLSKEDASDEEVYSYCANTLGGALELLGMRTEKLVEKVKLALE